MCTPAAAASITSLLSAATTREGAEAALLSTLAEAIKAREQHRRLESSIAGAVLDAMQKFNAEGDLLALACQAMYEYTVCTPNGCIDDKVKGAAPPVLLNAMEMHLMNAKLQQHAAAALWHLATGTRS